MSLVQIQKPRAVDPPWHHLVPGEPTVIFLVEKSRIYAVDSEAAARCMEGGPEAIGISSRFEVAPEIQLPAYPTAISLNIAQSCNLACGYCYADEGRYGGSRQMMSLEVAIRAIDQLLERADSSSVSIGFIGGEPLLNRRVLHDCVAYAIGSAGRRAKGVTFGLTTNGTLINGADLDLFRNHRFAVTISLDGGREVNDGIRHARNGHFGFDRILERVRPLLGNPGLAKVAARATVTRRDLCVSRHLDELAAEGFEEIGFSPLRTGPDPDLCLRGGDWDELLAEMQTAARSDWERIQRGGNFRFSNLAVSLKQLHRGVVQPLPCGAARNYVSIGANGDAYTCHRTVGQDLFRLGGPESGPTLAARREFLAGRHVDDQEPCKVCWARYLCGGGCHAEVTVAGRSGCDYIRGWLEFCLSLYPKVLSKRPDLLQGGAQWNLESFR